MGFHLLQTLFTNFSLVLLLMFAFTPTLSSATPTTYDFPIGKHACIDRCGNISIPYPFGTTETCYQSRTFWVTCNRTSSHPPKLYFGNSSVEITSISLSGQLKVVQRVAYDCYASDGTRNSNISGMRLSNSYTVNNTANKFTAVGCNTYGYVYGWRLDRPYTTGCLAMCHAVDDLVEGSCMGLGCCQTSIPQNVSRVDIQLKRTWNINFGNFNSCSYGFLFDESASKFSKENLTNLRNIEKLPMVLDWAIGNETCEEAHKNSTSYACKSPNSSCYKPDNGYGYRCRCEKGYNGNPYLENGCEDIDECRIPGQPKCKYDCVNTPGSFYCRCPKGYHGDGKFGGEGCSRGESLTSRLVAGIALVIVVLLLAACLMYLGKNKRRSQKAKQEFFLQNGGILLKKKLITGGRSPDLVKIFGSSELNKATRNFHKSNIIGQGGFGMVYKGFLPTGIVAIKKSKGVDPRQIDQFINEVIVLSGINHKNVVKLLGCCLETEVPILVYEFISNGTLFAHRHNQAKSCLLNWDVRLKIASETAYVLSYLHSVSIIHRDVKSDNILLDHTLMAKVSDFGASRLIPLDQGQLSTVVQGTRGYLDPEYLRTHQLTAKSDTYSFGVILLELLTGRKAIFFDMQGGTKTLADFFLNILQEESLFQHLDCNIVIRGNVEQEILEVARLAQRCLNVEGKDRPNMNEVATELGGLGHGRTHSWAQTEQYEAGNECLHGERLNGIASGCDPSTRYYSLKDHVTSPVCGGR